MIVPQPRNKKIRRSFDLLVFILATASILVGIELVFQLTALFVPATDSFFSGKDKNVRPVIAKSSPATGSSAVGVYPLDARGFRNAQIPDKAKAVTFGDNMTYGAELDWAETWPARLAQILGEPVYNMSMIEGSPADDLPLAAEASSLNPDWLILPLNLADDLVESCLKVYTDVSLKDFRNADKDISRDVLKEENRVPLMMPADTESLPADLVVQRSRKRRMGKLKTVQLFRRIFHQNIASPDKGKYQIGRLDAKVWNQSDLEKLEHQAQIRLRMLDRRDIRVAEGLRITLELIRQMKVQAAARNMNLMVMIIPTRESVKSRAFLRAGGHFSEEYQRLLSEEDHIRKKILTFLSSQNVESMDLMLPFHKMAADGIDPFGPAADSSLNPVGHELIAERLTVWFKHMNRRNREPDMPPKRPSRTLDSARSFTMRSIAVIAIVCLAGILLKTTPWQSRRPILLLVIYLAVEIVQLWNPIEIFPITSFKKYSRPVSRVLDYGRIVLRVEGSPSTLLASQISPALDRRQLNVVRSAIRNPDAAKGFMASMDQIVKKRGLGGLREIRFEEWRWDYLSDPYDPDRGFITRRTIIKRAPEGVYVSA